MFAMKPCVGLYISGILTEDFDSIAKTIQTFFSCSEDKPAAFDDWAKNIAYDKRNGEIRTVGEACVIPGQYQSFFRKLADAIASQNASATLHGYYDVYGDSPMGNFSCFTLSDNVIEWRCEEDVDIEFAAGSLMNVAAENGYDFNGSLSLIQAVSFLRELADSGIEDAQEAIDGFNFFIR